MRETTFIGCVGEPGWDCLSSPTAIIPALLIAGLAIAGFFTARKNRPFWRRQTRRNVLLTALLLVPGIVGVSYFMLFDAATRQRSDTGPLAQTLLILAAALVGAGLFLLLGSLAFWLGGVLGRRCAPALPLVIAIDGPAASGKGTLAKRLAAHFALPCLDTGLLYRAVARDVQKSGQRLDDVDAAVSAARALDAASLNDPALRGPAAGDAASVVAKIPAVRAALLDYQRTFARQPGGAVLDGRDIGTVVCPDATVKIYVTASAEERARRRHREHVAHGEAVTYETVLADIRARDARDSGRDIAPMQAAADAITLDTTSLDADAAFAAARQLVSARR